MNGFLCSTRLALDFAAPVEGASAALDHCHLLRSIASSTAHQIAPVDAYRRIVALTTVRSEDSQPQIFLAKSGGLLEVNEVFLCWWLVIGIVRLEGELVSV